MKFLEGFHTSTQRQRSVFGKALGVLKKKKTSFLAGRSTHYSDPVYDRINRVKPASVSLKCPESKQSESKLGPS